jgi:hypothetical protein
MNISSRGVLFTSSHDFPVGTRIEASISWPVLLDDKCPIHLIVRGRVKRQNQGLVVLEIMQHEFRVA